MPPPTSRVINVSQFDLNVQAVRHELETTGTPEERQWFEEWVEDFRDILQPHFGFRPLVRLPETSSSQNSHPPN